MADQIFPPLFLSIGAMKAGTTWLYAVLARHPALHFAMEKEIHYFYHRYVDRERLSEEKRLSEARSRYLLRFDPTQANIDAVRANLRWIAAYLDRPVDDFWYRGLFQLRDHQEYACDFSNLNAHLPEQVWPRIAAKSEKLRVLYTMRDPLERLWSHIKFHLQHTGALEKLQSWTPEDFKTFARRKHIWENAEYGRVLRSLRAGLGAENYKVMFYEDLHQDRRAGLRDIERFLDVAPFAYPQDLLEKRFTQSTAAPMPAFFGALFQAEVTRILRDVEDAGYEVPSSWTSRQVVQANLQSV